MNDIEKSQSGQSIPQQQLINFVPKTLVMNEPTMPDISGKENTSTIEIYNYNYHMPNEFLRLNILIKPQRCRKT